jgi:hypothetical protein
MSAIDTTVAAPWLSQGAAAPSGSPRGVSRASLLRRRIAALLALLLLIIVLTVAVGRVGAEAELADPVAGHAVIAPGDTLWDVAVATAPDGVDPREQLAGIRALNGLDGATLAPWTVVLLPAR